MIFLFLKKLCDRQMPCSWIGTFPRTKCLGV